MSLDAEDEARLFVEGPFIVARGRPQRVLGEKSTAGAGGVGGIEAAQGSGDGVGTVDVAAAVVVSLGEQERREATAEADRSAFR